jgi:sugar phosphate isomerase/epimerase
VLFSLSSACLYLLPLRRLFALAAEAGCDGIELVMAPEVWLRGARHVRGLVAECGQPVLSVHQAMVPLTPRGAGAARMRDATEFALELGCPIVVIHDPFCDSWESAAAQRWLVELERCQTLVQGAGTRLALENPGWYHHADRNNLFAQPMALLAFARRYGLDLTYDTCHAGSAEMNIQPVYDLLRERVINIHLSDLKRTKPPLGLDVFRTLLVHHQMPGEGVLPLAQFVAQLAADGYAGPVTLEISLMALRFWSPRALLQRTQQALQYLRQAAVPSR